MQVNELDNDTYNAAGNRRRRVRDRWVVLHVRCCVCLKWYGCENTGGVGRHHYCTNCHEEFPQWLLTNDPDTYNSLIRFGIWRRWNK